MSIAQDHRDRMSDETNPTATSAQRARELLGCPWCGEFPSLRNDGDPNYPIVIVDAHVEPCPLGFHTLQISYPDEATAIAAWNTRAPTTQPAEDDLSELRRPGMGWKLSDEAHEQIEQIARGNSPEAIAQVQSMRIGNIADRAASEDFSCMAKAPDQCVYPKCDCATLAQDADLSELRRLSEADKVSARSGVMPAYRDTYHKFRVACVHYVRATLAREDER